MSQGTFLISFEFFPPKTQVGQDALLKTAAELAHRQPHFFSVTYGAGGSTREGTVQAVRNIFQQTGIEVAPHLSCLGLSRMELIDMLHIYQSLGVRRLVALRGDLPSGMGYSCELRYASELIALIREVTHDYFHIEVAAYPEGHPQAQNIHADLLNLKRKVEAGANSAITQYFFNPDAYFYFIDECAKQNIFIPIVPGIMPITNYAKLARFSEMCGAEIPLWLRKYLESYRDDVESIKAFGLEVVYHLCQRLVEGGAPGLHFYTLNQAEPTLSILNMLEQQSMQSSLQQKHDLVHPQQ